MSEDILNMVGLALKAGRLEIGEEPVGACCRARGCRLILVASDAADNSVRRVRHFSEEGQCLWCRIPSEKDDLGSAVGRTSCAMVGVTDIGFAASIAGKLAKLDSEQYGELAERFQLKAKRAAQRRKDRQTGEKTAKRHKKTER